MHLTFSRKLVGFTALLLTVAVVTVIAISYHRSRDVLISSVRNDILPARIEAVSNYIARELQPFLTIATGMNADLADMEIVRTGRAGPEDDQAIVNYLTRIKNTYGTTAAFFASAVSERYYVYTRFMKVLSKGNEKDAWFYDLLNSGKPYLYNLDLDENTNNLSVFLNYRITDASGKVLGVGGVGNSLTELTSRINANNSTSSFRILLLNQKGQVTIGGDEKTMGRPYTDDRKLLESIVANRDFAVHSVEKNGAPYLMAAYFVKDVGWNIVMEIPEAEVLKAVRSLAYFELIICLVCVPVLVLLLAAMISRLLRPLRKISAELQELEADLTHRFDYSSQDEIGGIARGVNVFLEKLQMLIANNKRISGEVLSIAGAASSSSEQALDELEKQKESTYSIATSLDRLSSSSREVADMAQEASRIAGEAREKTNRGSEEVLSVISSMGKVAGRVDTAVQKMEVLDNSVQQIRMILEVIATISDKTNLLALNAAIEAARAGEAGRGFAVVADEVRSLAVKTQSSTGEITRVIGELQAHTTELSTFMRESQSESTRTVDSARSAEAIMRDMQEHIGSIDGRIARITAAAAEQHDVASTLSQHSADITGSVERVCTLLQEQDGILVRQEECAQAQKSELDRFSV